MQRPSLFNYEDYRKFLADWFLWMKETKGGFSHRAFSRWAGFKSPNQLLLVIEGKRNIPLSSINKYLRVLKLKAGEKRYFELLVKFNQCKDMREKTEYFHELSAYWLKKGTVLEEDQYEYLSHWYYTAIREMVTLKDFRENGQWISKKLDGLITSEQAQQAVGVLLKLGLLKRGKNRKLIQASHYITTGNEVDSVGAYLFHEQMIRLALASLREKSSDERNLTSLTFTLRKTDYEMIVSETNAYRKRLIAALGNRDDVNSDEELYQLNIHLFPIRRG